MKVIPSRSLQRLLPRMLLVILVAACSSQVTPTPTPAPAQQVTITFAVNDWDLPQYERLAERFHKTHPHISVRLLSENAILGTEHRDILSKLATAADTFTGPAGLIRPQDTRRGLLRDLTPLLEADPTFEAEDFYPGLLEQFRWDGGTWVLPVRTTLALIFYDKAAFDQAGIAPPQPGWSYEDFTQVTQQLTVREGDQTLRYGFINPWPRAAIALILGRAGTWTDETTTPPLPRLDDPAMAEAVNWYTDLTRQGVTPRLEKTVRLVELIQDGKAAMWPGYSDQLGDYMPYYPDLGVAPLPEGKAIVGWKQAAGYAMSAGTAHPQESWLWLTFLTRQPLATEEGTVPPRRSLAGAVDVWASLDEETAAVYRYVLEKFQMEVPAGLSLDMPLLTALGAIFAGERGVEEALAEAQAQALAAAQEAQQVTPATPVAVATPKPERATGEEVTITFCGRGETAPYHALAEAFHDDHPEIMVEVTVPEQWGVPYWAEACDCFTAFDTTPYVPEHRQHVLDLQPLVDADQDLPLDDFYPGFLETWRWQGDLLGLPADGDVKVMYYHQDLFDAAGVAYPQPGWDLDDFLEKAVALTREEEGESKQYGYIPLDPVCYDLLFFLGQHGATVADVSTRPPRPQLDTPAMVEGVRWYADLALVHGVMPPLYIKDYFRDRDAHLQRQRDMVSTGRVAMWAEYPGNMPAQAFPFRVGMAPLPLGQGKMNQNKIVAYVISVNSPYPEACWQWIKFLTGQLAVVQGVPPRRSLMETPEYQQRVGEEALATFQFALERSVGSVNPVYEEYPWVYTVRRYWFYEAFDRVMEGAEVEEALAEAQAKAEAFVACLGGRVTASEYDGELRETCAQEVDPDYESW